MLLSMKTSFLLGFCFVVVFVIGLGVYGVFVRGGGGASDTSSLVDQAPSPFPVFKEDKTIVTVSRSSQGMVAREGEVTRLPMVVVDELDIPWDFVFLPDGDILITERGGKIVRVENGNTVRIQVPGVKHTGEGGLLGIELHPEFVENNLLYLYITQNTDGGKTINQVVQFRYEDGALVRQGVIVSDIPGARFHNGGRVRFGPDGYLYITTGDSVNPEYAQDISSLAGKILRVSEDGECVSSNPFGTCVYSYGHRNPQGIAWLPDGSLFSTEHGRSGIRSGLDELNRIDSGGNYGWPASQGDSVLPGHRAGVIHSGSDVWAPGGLAYGSGSLFFGGLRGEALYEIDLSHKQPTLQKHFEKVYGRIRTTKFSPTGDLCFTTSNRDGRGTIRSGDDKLVCVPLDALENA